MKKWNFVKGLVILAMITSLPVVVMAAENASDEGIKEYLQPEPKHFHEFDNDFMKAFHNPMEGLTMGLDLRLREVYARDIFSLNDSYGDGVVPPPGTGPGNWNNYHWQRYRTRWSTQWALNEDVDFNTRLTWEFWGHVAPDESFDPFFNEKSYDFDEAIFDNFNIQMRNAFDMPLTLTVGRQDIILGTGWLVLDGTPADGSRTIFFDAIRATYELSETSKVDLIYIQQYDDEDQYIKPFNHGAVENRRHLTQLSDERGFITYLHNKLSETANNELYYIYKNEEASDWGAKYKGRGYDADIHTIGTRFFGPLDDHWSYSAEIAKQWGNYAGESLRSLGSNNKLTYAFNNDTQSEVHIGYEYMSGDDPDTSTNEQFDPLWGDWPQYQRGGDLQSYLWTFEGELGQVTNLHRFGLGHSFKPNDVWTIATDYNLLWADQNTFEGSTRGPGGALTFSDSGSFRGHMLTGLATYQCCKNFRTQFLVDYFIPGGYYDDPSTDDAMFARINVEWTF